MSQRLILTGERSGLLTHIATTESVSLCGADEKPTAFVELESAVGSIASLGGGADLNSPDVLTAISAL